MFNIDWNSDARKALGVYATLTAPFGLWPLQENNIFLKIRCCVVTFSTTLIVLVAVYENHLDCVLDESGINNLLVIVYASCELIGMTTFYVHCDKLLMIVKSAVRDCTTPDDEKYKAITCKSCINYNRITLFYIVGTTIATATWLVKSFIIDPNPMIEVTSYEDDYNENVTIVPGRKYLYPATCLFGNVSQYSYRIIIFFQLIQIIISAGVFLSLEISLIVMVQYLSSQYAILQKKIDDCEDLDGETKTRRRYIVLVARHNELLQLSKCLETSFDVIIMTQLIASALLVNAAGMDFLTSSKNGEVLTSLNNLNVIYSAMMHTFMYCDMGEHYSNHGTKIAFAVYNMSWYAMPRNFRNDIVLVILRSRSSFHLTAGKVIKMTRGTFVNIAKILFSFMTLLRI